MKKYVLKNITEEMFKIPFSYHILHKGLEKLRWLKQKGPIKF